MSILIKGGRVIDPANRRDEITDLLLDKGKIIKLEPNIKSKVDKTIEANGKIVMPGIVDMHVHLREPGREDKETIDSATLAALKGGVTSVLAMPNTTPAIDCVSSVELISKIIQRSARCEVLIAAAITRERLGKRLVDMSELKKKGVIALSDDGVSVDSNKLMLEALKLARENRLLVICHSEDKMLSCGGIVNLGIISTRMGVRGISSESEYKRVQRDVKLAQNAKAAIHIAHISCAESVEILRQAKKTGTRVTAETAPHYFSLSEESAVGFDTNMKMNPPLRTKDDVRAIKEGLRDGTIDVIASDHAPHAENEKDIEFDHAEFGVIGLETELAVSITELLVPGILNWPDLVRKLSTNPARILGIEKGTLAEGRDADITIVSADKEWTVKKQDFLSKSQNSAFIGKKLKGVVEYTIYKGKIFEINSKSYTQA